MDDAFPPLGFRRIKVIALAVRDLERANRFYGQQLELSPVYEGTEQVGWQLDQVVLMLKSDWETPTASPNPRVTIETDQAWATQESLRRRGITIADEIQPYGDFFVGSFLDSEGNKLWFCSQ